MIQWVAVQASAARSDASTTSFGPDMLPQSAVLVTRPASKASTANVQFEGLWFSEEMACNDMQKRAAHFPVQRIFAQLRAIPSLQQSVQSCAIHTAMLSVQLRADPGCSYSMLLSAAFCFVRADCRAKGGARLQSVQHHATTPRPP